CNANFLKIKTDAIFGCFYLISTFKIATDGEIPCRSLQICVRGWSHAEGSAKHRAQQVAEHPTA
ncbi:hypothetical protein, partial [Treponema sp. UBA7567]|uniref:hypothetical protein n=1 Tax=Treponema sp. UBA7567 TaxID=1947748 RepID=UPI0025F7E030